ncbi:MarC family protein [Edaphobacter bradus]|uniref:MarC family protein n=1 Tax=Edaphobacter bradus TaxID=2259016 RepID=UPI0021DFE3A8|nr:MarC family protein [Edaphobacter bradus]
MEVLFKYFALGFSALLPVVNPLGSALVFLGLVGLQTEKVYKSLARQITINMVLFFAVTELVGSYVLEFFGISLEVVQLAGGMVVTSIGWQMLNQSDAGIAAKDKQSGAGKSEDAAYNWAAKTFYPLMFPITAGPGSLVVMLTLSAHASNRKLSTNVLAHVGLMVAVLLLSILVYLCYAYSPQITRRISPATVQGILRVVAFILLCIGVQIAWHGLEPLLDGLISQVRA